MAEAAAVGGTGLSPAAAPTATPAATGEARAERRHINRLGLLVGLGAVTMLFAAFTSAYLVRSGGADWVEIALPPVLWLGTGLLALSSVTLELARRAFAAGNAVGFRSWSALTAALGTGFLAGQFASWRALNEAGLYLQSNPKSSFFFVLTGVHAVHLAAGVVALLALFGLAAAGRLVPGKSDAPTLTAIYWHFVGGLWLYLLAVLFVVA